MYTKQSRYKGHSYFMMLALKQAEKILGNTKDNPAVGCIVTKNNHIIGAGFTSLNGRPHAEYNAINFCKKFLKDSTMYVTLEPCSHYGKTPPCVNLIIKNKIKKVFFSINDPDKRSYNKSIDKFKKIGIKTSRGLSSPDINNFYRSYIKNKKKNLPFVTCKIAISKDHFTVHNKKKWITNKYSRARVHLLRAKHDCLITSSQTIIKDDPNLTCRINGLFKRSPTRIILDKNLKIPAKSKVLGKKLRKNTIIFYNKDNKDKIHLLRKLKIKVYRIALNTDDDLDLKKVIIRVRKLGFSRIFLESGIKLATNFLRADLIDDLKIFMSNTKLGKNGSGSIKNNFIKFIKNRKFIKENVNLFGEKLISYKMK